MKTLFVGKNFVTLESVSSTNTFASELLESRPAEGTVVQAMAQTAGRGQQGSAWHALPGENLTFSLILYPTWLEPRRLFLLNKMVALALRDAVAACLPPGPEVRIKWPNDILLEKRKVAGILIETSIDRDRVGSAIIGIGLNVNQREFEPTLHGQAISMGMVATRELDTNQVLASVLEHLEAGYMAMRAGRQDPIERQYLQHLHAYQEDTEVEVGGERQTVHVVGVDPEGRLAVQQGQKLYFYNVKEIRFIL